jgi:hypothetical protein
MFHCASLGVGYVLTSYKMHLRMKISKQRQNASLIECVTSQYLIRRMYITGEEG